MVSELLGTHFWSYWQWELQNVTVYCVCVCVLESCWLTGEKRMRGGRISDDAKDALAILVQS